MNDFFSNSLNYENGKIYSGLKDENGMKMEMLFVVGVVSGFVISLILNFIPLTQHYFPQYITSYLPKNIETILEGINIFVLLIFSSYTANWFLYDIKTYPSIDQKTKTSGEYVDYHNKK